MTGPLGELERSLRDGPPDEVGYRPRMVAPPPGSRTPEVNQAVPVQRITGGTSLRRIGSVPAWQYLAAVLIVAATIAAVGIVRTRLQTGVAGTGSPSPSAGSPGPSLPSSSDSPSLPIVIPPMTQTFVSARNGFSVRYPDGWTVTTATAAWPANAFLPYGHPALDTLARPGEARLMVASQALANGQTEDEWLRAFFRPYTAGEPCGADRATWPRLEVDGVSGYLDMADCPVPIDSRISDRDVGFDALVFAGGRVYQIGFDGDVDLAYFKVILATVRLDPAKATN